MNSKNDDFAEFIFFWYIPEMHHDRTQSSPIFSLGNFVTVFLILFTI